MAQLRNMKVNLARGVGRGKGEGEKWERKRWIIFEVTNISLTGFTPRTFWFFSNSTRQSRCLFLWDCSAVGGSLLCWDNWHSLSVTAWFVLCVCVCVCVCVSRLFVVNLLISSRRHHWLFKCVSLTPWKILALISDSRMGMCECKVRECLVQMCWRQIFFLNFFSTQTLWLVLWKMVNVWIEFLQYY